MKIEPGLFIFCRDFLPSKRYKDILSRCNEPRGDAEFGTGFCVALGVYYLVWKYVVNFFNEALGIA